MKRFIKESGFSLFEVITVLFLMGLVLGTVAALSKETLSTLKFLQEKSETLQSATLGLERLASELSEAVGAPGSVAAATPLVFFKVSPNEVEAVGNDRDDPLDPADTFDLPDTWVRVYPNPVQVTYAESTGRTMTRTAGGQTSVVANNVEAFSVAAFNSRPDTFEVNLSIKENRRVVQFRNICHAPGLAR